MERKNIRVSYFIIFIFFIVLAFFIYNSLYNANISNILFNNDLTNFLDEKDPKNHPKSSWIDNGSPIGTEAYHNNYPRICSDEAGGAIIAWEDDRSLDYEFDIYAQKVDENGTILWYSKGDYVADASDFFPAMEMCSDEAGGAILVWKDLIDCIRANRINENGVRQWVGHSSGLLVCSSPESTSRPHIASDGAGGAIIAWEDLRNLPYGDIYAQYINENGTEMWTENGIPICTSSNEQFEPKMCSDGEGAAIIIWVDYRSSNHDIYASRVNAAGVKLWGSQGSPVHNSGYYSTNYKVYSDGAGGAYVIWNDATSTIPTLRIQHL